MQVYLHNYGLFATRPEATYVCQVGLKVGKKVGFSSGPDSNKVNFEVMLKVHQID